MANGTTETIVAFSFRVLISIAGACIAVIGWLVWGSLTDVKGLVQSQWSAISKITDAEQKDDHSIAIIQQQLSDHIAREVDIDMNLAKGQADHEYRVRRIESGVH